jgi:hypothetical protein
MKEGEKRVAAAITLCALLASGSAYAEQTYQFGRIINVTYVEDVMLIRLDTGLPGNCAGTPYGWMMIPSTSKPMIAFVTGLLLRGDLASIPVGVYTSGLGSAGYCQIGQIDPAE